jgi:hypothetical protein
MKGYKLFLYKCTCKDNGTHIDPKQHDYYCMYKVYCIEQSNREGEGGESALYHTTSK